MLHQFSRTVDSFWFRLPIRRQITILIALPALGLAIALVSLGRLHPASIDESAGVPQPASATEQPFKVATIAIGATAGISLISVIAALYWVKRLHQQLYRRETQFVQTKLLMQAITTSLDDTLMVANRDGHIESMNPAGTRMFGYAAAEIIGRDLRQLFDESALAAPSTLKTTSSPKTHEMTVGQHQSGSSFPVEIWIHDLPQLGKMLAIARDMTYQEQLKTRLNDCIEQLARATTDLEQTQSELRDVKLACHDLKSPLQAIAHLSSWIEADLDERVKGQTQEQMHLLRQRVQRMEELVSHILRPESASDEQ
jgi:PAS domain S-box-containing protein